MVNLQGASAGTAIHIPGPVSQLLFNAIPIIVMLYGFWDEYSDFVRSQSLTSYIGTIEEFDFIIVGGGSAGSVLANRLSKDGNNAVLLLEAGGNPNPIQSVPLIFPMTAHNPPVDHEFYTVPQTNACLALKDQKSFWPRGRGLGGSSNLNAMYFQRGHKNDYDKWAELSGSKEWEFDNILRNFKNIEDYHGEFYSEKWHSNDGNGVYISVSNEKRLLSEALEAAVEMGYPIKDVNGNQEASFCYLDATIKNGRRHSAYDAFVQPVIHRDNLKIYRYARVTQVKLDSNKKATGVIYKRHGVERFVKARKEVILSAGAIDSPRILLTSGIGPKQDLEDLGIKSIVDLPVGQNLQDHIMTNLGPFIVKTPITTFNLARDLTLDTITSYMKNGSGPLSTPYCTNFVGYIPSSLALNANPTASPKDVTPDIQLMFIPMAPFAYHILEKFLSIRKGYIAGYFGDSDKKDAFFVNVMLGKYKSRGTLKLSSIDPMEKPTLDPRYLSHPDDIKVMAEGLNFTVTMVETTKAYQKVGAKLIDKHLPGCEAHVLKSMEYYECYIRQLTLTVYHQCATCTMGKGENDPLAVVGPDLRVLKTSGLRVVDGSVIPEIPNSNINAAIMMIADKASEFILDSWSTKTK